MTHAISHRDRVRLSATHLSDDDIPFSMCSASKQLLLLKTAEGGLPRR